jgi:hypothetical protein
VLVVDGRRLLRLRHRAAPRARRHARALEHRTRTCVRIF